MRKHLFQDKVTDFDPELRDRQLGCTGRRPQEAGAVKKARQIS